MSIVLVTNNDACTYGTGTWLVAKTPKQKWDVGPLRDAWLDYQKTQGNLPAAKLARLASDWLGRRVLQQTVSDVLNGKGEPGFAFGCAICAAMGLDPLEFALPWKRADGNEPGQSAKKSVVEPYPQPKTVTAAAKSTRKRA